MPRRLSRLLLLVVLLTAWCGGRAGAADRYDPRLRFRTLVTPSFFIHYHQGAEGVARRLAEIAEATAVEMAPRLGRASGRVHVILVDQHDSSNGWATPFPYNVIEISAAAPRGGELIGNTSDWLRLVFVHEYTHILHLDRSRGLFGAGRRVFGRHPLAMPNVFTPSWQIEGIATHYESLDTGEGRVPAGDFRLLLDRASAAGRFASLDRASSDRIDWPSGNTPYLYGAYFHRYLAETYGEASLVRLADATAGRVPYLGSGAFDDVFGKPLGSLWADFEAHAAARASTPESRATRLTDHGFVVSSPVHARDGRLFYAVSTPHAFPTIRELLPGGGSRAVTTRAGGGRLSWMASESIVFDQLEFVRSVGLQSDLFAVEVNSGAVRRLTREARAADPDVSPADGTIAMTIQGPDRRALATLAPGAEPTLLVSEPDTHFATPRWSPDGRTIAVERRMRGGLSRIVIVDAATRSVREIPGPGGRSITPAWTPDGESLLFASDADGAFRIHRLDVGTGALTRLANAGAQSRSPAPSPDGDSLVFIGDTSSGYDLFELSMRDAVWEQVDASTPRSAGAGSATVIDTPMAGQPYRPWGMMRPRFWTPIVEPDGDDLALGAGTAGADALGRHAYAAGATWSTRARPDWYAAYSYDRWRPTVVLTVADDTDPWRGGVARDVEVNLGASVAFRTTRRTQSLFAAAHVSADSFDCVACTPGVDTRVRRHALRGGWSFTSARRYGYSISREEGVAVTAAGEWAPRGLGSTGDSQAMVAEVRAFLPAAPRHGVVALRAAAAIASGDVTAAREFGAGGSGQSGGLSFGRDAVGLVRGFDTDEVVGRRALVLNADYRLPLAWVERGVGTWPAFVRALHGAVFVDAGAAWSGALTRDRVRVSAGGEIASDLVFGYVVPLTIAGGVAWRHDPTRDRGGAAVFARVGAAF
jgi:hypothetical protein